MGKDYMISDYMISDYMIGLLIFDCIKLVIALLFWRLS